MDYFLLYLNLTFLLHTLKLLKAILKELKDIFEL